VSDLGTIRELVKAKIQDDAQFLSSAEIDSTIREVLFRYSKDSPRVLFQRYAGENKRDYDLPADFIVGFSWILSIEYPADKEVPIIVDPNNYTIYANEKGHFLKFLTLEPSKGQHFILAYTTTHKLDKTSSTIPAFDEDAFSNLAASFCCRMLANRFAQHSDSTIAADIVDYGGKVAQYNSLADNYQRLYREHVKGRSEVFAEALATGQADWDMLTYWRTEFLFHRTQQR